MDMKEKVLKIATKNTRFMAFIYDHYRNDVEREIQDLADRMSKIDTIKDVQPLIDLKKDIVSNNRHFVSYNGNQSNYRLYGIGNALFGEVSEQVWKLPSIEHGLIFYNQNWTDTFLTARASCVTFGCFRKEILKRFYNTPIFEVGPYIQYAGDYYSAEKLEMWKKELGKTLLVFPAHSTDDSSLKYSYKKYIQEIERRASKYNSVIVCVFWWNLDDPIVQVFKNMGYYIVSAGYREDPNFLKRQKALITVADHIICDSVGTHIGYCYKLGKTIEFVTTQTEVKSLKSDKDSFYTNQCKRIQNAFQSQDKDKIEKIMNFYWGNNISLEKDDLKLIAEINKDITVAGKYQKNQYYMTACEMLGDYKRSNMKKFFLLKKAMGIE